MNGKKYLTKSPSKSIQRPKFLKEAHSLTHGFANTIVSLHKQKESSGEDLIEEQYSKKKDLFPIYREIEKFVKQLGDEVKVSPKKSSVSFVRSRQFVLVKPAAKSRIDLGLKLDNVDPNGRLEGSGPFETMCSHRIRIENSDHFDNVVKNWIKEAYNQS